MTFLRGRLEDIDLKQINSVINMVHIDNNNNKKFLKTMNIVMRMVMTVTTMVMITTRIKMCLDRFRTIPKIPSVSLPPPPQ